MMLLGTYDLLNEVRMGENDVNDAMVVAEKIIDTHDRKKMGYWHRAATVLLTGLILHTIYSQKDKTLNSVLNLLTDVSMTYYKLMEFMLETIHDPQGKYNWVDPITKEPTQTHPVVASIAKEYKRKDYVELSGVVSTVVTNLRLFRNPIILNNHNDDDPTIEINVKGGKLGDLTFFTTLSQIEKDTLYKGLLTEKFKSWIFKTIFNRA